MSRFPLRARVMAWFSLVTLVVFGALAFATWQLATGYMIDQRERSAVGQAAGNARLVEAALRNDSPGLRELLTGLAAGSAVLLVDDGDWISGGTLVDPRRLPDGFLDMVRRGESARQRTVLDGVPVLAVGLPVPGQAATYVEVSPLRELDRTFRFLSWTLVIGTLASALGGALLGRWAAHHALRPLRRFTDTAAKAAGGDLSVRLPNPRDPDLESLATAFNDTTERLQQRVTRDIRFAGDVSHELRSPLTTMLNAMSVLQRRSADLPADTRQAVDLLSTDLRRFRRMVDDLLEMSRGDQDTDQASFELVDLAGLVRAVAEQHACASPNTLELTANPWVLADRRRLERAVTNLLDNATRHGQGLVRLAVLHGTERARIEVDDAGPGIAADDRSTSSNGSPAAPQPHVIPPMSARGWGWPSSPSMCAITTATCGSRTGPAAVHASSSSCQRWSHDPRRHRCVGRHPHRRRCIRMRCEQRGGTATDREARRAAAADEPDRAVELQPSTNHHEHGRHEPAASHQCADRPGLRTGR